VLTQCDRYALHLLSSEQIRESVQFSSPATQSHFHAFPYYLNKSHIPILPGSMSVLECVPEQQQIVGDHEIWYSRVHNIVQDKTTEPVKPLLYYESSYRSIGDEVFLQAFENHELKLEEWTHRAHVRMAWIYFSAADVTDPHIRIRQGIQAYNRANATRVQHGYNETITSFYCHLVSMAVQRDKQQGLESSDFMEFLERYPFLDQSSFLFEYYTKEYVHSDRAKKEFLLPDRKPLPTSLP
jgi:hypothetical protein